jgi:triacylglycerol lipase
VLTVLAAACGSITDPSPSLARAPRPTRNPILFVHGWNSSSAAWTTMVGRFKKDGWRDSELANFSYNTGQSNKVTAALIEKKVDSILAATGASKVDIVTHSMGALSARYYVRSLTGEGKVDALVSLGGPNHGTTTAGGCAFLQPSCAEMYPGSTFLAGLNEGDETPGASRYATWWSWCDEVINPQTSTELAGATNTLTACMSHSRLREDAAVYAQVRDWVNAPAGAAALIATR